MPISPNSGFVTMTMVLSKHSVYKIVRLRTGGVHDLQGYTIIAFSASVIDL